MTGEEEFRAELDELCVAAAGDLLAARGIEASGGVEFFFHSPPGEFPFVTFRLVGGGEAPAPIAEPEPPAPTSSEIAGLDL